MNSSWKNYLLANFTSCQVYYANVYSIYVTSCQYTTLLPVSETFSFPNLR